MCHVNQFGWIHYFHNERPLIVPTLKLSQQVFDFQKRGHDCHITQPNLHTKYSPVSPAEMQCKMCLFHFALYLLKTEPYGSNMQSNVIKTELLREAA